jgi:hypothetical protein
MASLCIAEVTAEQLLGIADSRADDVRSKCQPGSNLENANAAVPENGHLTANQMFRRQSTVGF